MFLPQGLQLALFVAMALIAACILARAKTKVLRLPANVAATYLVPILVLCKTLGAVIYAMAAAPLAIFCRPSTCVKIAMILTIFVCGYPALRTQQLVPVESVLRLAGVVSKKHAHSSACAVNESLLMEKANQKPLFGWGGWDDATGFTMPIMRRMFRSQTAAGSSISACMVGSAISLCLACLRCRLSD